jgi:hypothetical protein
MRLTCVCVFGWSIGCGSVDSLKPIDASIDAQTAIDALDASSICSPSAKFGAPVPLVVPDTTGMELQCPRLTADELTIYFGGRVAPGNLHLSWKLT